MIEFEILGVNRRNRSLIRTLLLKVRIGDIKCLLTMAFALILHRP